MSERYLFITTTVNRALADLPHHFVSRRRRFSSVVVKLCGGFFVVAKLCCFGGSLLLCLRVYCVFVVVFDELTSSIL